MPSIPVLLNLLANVPDRPRGFLELGGRFAFTRLVYRLLCTLKDMDAVYRAAEDSLPHMGVSTLGRRLSIYKSMG